MTELAETGLLPFLAMAVAGIGAVALLMLADAVARWLRRRRK